MKKFSKLLSFILILSFIFIIAGCSNDTTNQGSTTEQTPQTSSTESTSSESDTTDTRKGGKNNPYTFDELYAYIQTLTKGNTVDNQISYVEGIVGKVETYEGSITFYLVSGSKQIKVYQCKTPTFIPSSGDKVVVKGFACNYYSALELCPFNNGSEDILPEIISSEHVDYDVEFIVGEHCTCSQATGVRKSGSLVSFTVTPEEGYYVKSVSIGPARMTSDEGLYLFTVSGDTTITITIAEGTGVEYESVRSIDLNPQAEGNTFDKSSSYTTTWTASNSQASYEISSMNNNKNGWTVIKAGRESKDATAYISTKSAITEAVSYVSITVDAIGDVSKVTSFKLIIADNSSFTDATEISLTIFAGENIFEIDNPQAGMYYKIELITQPTGKNGAFVFSHLEFFAEK